ncbi:hypothetical protein [Aurantibacillus circumpalustris]|uniref:hypothetical protein n=1 Tax=Aurantibacillus circumpalustris TaxID=3036359 RepID=UPI00295BF4C7|nr:hypothetical protein [Aurantibacillus circumpalustris]
MIRTLQQSLTQDQIEIIKAVLYFDVFKYPLTKDELFENSAITISREQFSKELLGLLNNNLLKQDGEFILHLERTKNDLSKRLLGNEGAKKIMPIAVKYSRIIASFPFVEGVCLSGGLSKNYYDNESDIDFFIITKPNRLWICRTLLIIRYKLLPKKKRKFWCTNYFISSDSLFIPDNNPFSGTELAHLIPTVNYSAYNSLLEENNWYKRRFPNKQKHPGDLCQEAPQPFLKSFLEKILSGSLGTKLDDYFLKITLKHWQKKYPELAVEDFELQFRSRKNVCKRHTKGFQNKVLKLWREKQTEYETRFNIELK